MIVDSGPYRLDDATVARMIRVWNESTEWNQVFAEQGARWRREATGHSVRQAVEDYCKLVEHERVLIDKNLVIARKLATVTIEKLLAKSDLQGGV